MTDLLDPKNDFVFKRVFADEPELLVALINAVRFRAPPVAELTDSATSYSSMSSSYARPTG